MKLLAIRQTERFNSEVCGARDLIRLTQSDLKLCAWCSYMRSLPPDERAENERKLAAAGFPKPAA